MNHDISTQELSALISEGTPLTLLEALPPEHYAREHLPGAKNLPLQGLEARVRELDLEPNALLVTYAPAPPARIPTSLGASWRSSATGTCASTRAASRRGEKPVSPSSAASRRAWREGRPETERLG